MFRNGPSRSRRLLKIERNGIVWSLKVVRLETILDIPFYSLYTHNRDSQLLKIEETDIASETLQIILNGWGENSLVSIMYSFCSSLFSHSF